MQFKTPTGIVSWLLKLKKRKDPEDALNNESYRNEWVP